MTTFVMMQPTVAQEYGLLKAIILQHVHLGVQTGFAKENKMWKPSTLSKFSQELGGVSRATIQRHIKTLVDIGALRETPNNRGKAYRVDYKSLGLQEHIGTLIKEAEAHIKVWLKDIREFGLTKAVVLGAIKGTLKRVGNLIKGECWAYKTGVELEKELQTLSKNTISRSTTLLVRKGVLKSSSNFNRSSSDRTLWYTVNTKYEYNHKKPTVIKMGKGVYQNGASTVIKMGHSNPIYKDLDIRPRYKCDGFASLPPLVISFLEKKEKRKKKIGYTLTKVYRTTYPTEVIPNNLYEVTTTINGVKEMNATALLKTSGRKDKKNYTGTVRDIMSKGLVKVKPSTPILRKNTVMGFTRFFHEAMSTYDESYKPMSFTGKERGMVKHLLAKCSDDLQALEYVMLNWRDFFHYLEDNNLSFNTPRLPLLPFLLSKVGYVPTVYQKHLEFVQTCAEDEVKASEASKRSEAAREARMLAEKARLEEEASCDTMTMKEASKEFPAEYPNMVAYFTTTDIAEKARLSKVMLEGGLDVTKVV